MTETKLEQTAAQIRKSPANYEYFFQNVDDPAWLGSLREMGFFRSPPEPKRSEEWIRYPGWAESRYLVRVAARAPDEVLRIALAIPATDNPRVHQNLLEIAAQLPGPSAAQIARKEAKWLRAYSAHLVGIPAAATALITHLARECQAKAGFDLAGALLALEPAQGRAGERDAVTAQMTEYEYAAVINGAWPALTEADPRRALSFLCDRLGDVIRASDEQLGGHDLTNFLRRAVESHAQNVGNNFLDILVDVVRDTAVGLAQTPDGLHIATTVLEARPEPMFQRIRLHLLRVHGTPEDATAALSNHTFAYELNYWHEYGEFLRTRFADLSPEQQGEVLETIARGPELKMTPWREEQGFTAESLEQSGRRSVNERYLVVAEHLTGEHRAAYDALREEFGTPEHPTFLSYTTEWTGPTSPYTQADLAELNPQQVVEKLREWTPEPGPQTPSPEGLGRALQAAVAARPAEFAEIAAEFRGLDASYVRAALSGLTDAARAEKPFAWRPILELSAWVLEQTAADDEQDERDQAAAYMDHDPHWGWARKQVASLLSQAFAKGDVEAQQSERETIWTLLSHLAEDPDPTPEQETRHDGEGMDAATLAINTTRGEAMHGVVRYMLWVERALDENAGDAGDTDDEAGEDSSNQARATGIGFAPEARELLERHLDSAVDPSLAIRAVYGQWFPQFVRLDTDWARQLAPLVFPTAEDRSGEFDAAWNAYVVFNRPWTAVFDALRDAYAHAVARAAERDDSAVRTDSPDERLAEHLLTYRVLGATAGDGDDLFAEFWRAAGPALRKQVLTHAGWSLERSPKLGAEIGARFVATWEWIFAETSATDPGALAGFGAWLGAPTMDGGWLLTQAIAVLGLGVHLDPAFVVYRALPRVASEHPRDVVAVLRGMTLTDTEGWSVYGATDEIHEALQLALVCDDEDVRRDAGEVVDLLGARGMTDEFRDLASGSAAQAEPELPSPPAPSSETRADA